RRAQGRPARRAARAHDAHEPASHGAQQGRARGQELLGQHLRDRGRLISPRQAEMPRISLPIDRRAVLKGALGACFGLALAPLARRAAAADAIQTTRVTDKLVALSGAGGNVLACSTGDGLVVVDSGAAASGPPLVAALAALPNGAHVHTLFNTHWHLEQI